MSHSSLDPTAWESCGLGCPLFVEPLRFFVKMKKR
uniref:Uncharacterized protein n=1 Tax=Rhizophora mucronata TaxID=61149 RepID=A0A2P2PV86_RHIMU